MQVLTLEINFKVGGVGYKDRPQEPLTESLSSASEPGSTRIGCQWRPRMLWGSLAAGSKEPVMGDQGSRPGNSDPLSGVTNCHRTKGGA